MKDFIVDPATKFDFLPHDFVPFKDKEVCERVRKMSGKELEQREPWWHPEFQVKVMMNPHPVLIATLFSRLKAASEAGKTFTMILGNPEPDTYIPLAQLINYFRVDCSKCGNKTATPHWLTWNRVPFSPTSFTFHRPDQYGRMVFG